MTLAIAGVLVFSEVRLLQQEELPRIYLMASLDAICRWAFICQWRGLVWRMHMKIANWRLAAAAPLVPCFAIAAVTMHMGKTILDTPDLNWCCSFCMLCSTCGAWRPPSGEPATAILVLLNTLHRGCADAAKYRSGDARRLLRCRFLASCLLSATLTLIWMLLNFYFADGKGAVRGLSELLLKRDM